MDNMSSFWTLFFVVGLEIFLGRMLHHATHSTATRDIPQPALAKGMPLFS
ncbi:hypothetical protein [Paenibacillus kribbensis]|nr:hypothetical protein [Paenibacillus kribbensis]